DPGGRLPRHDHALRRRHGRGRRARRGGPEPGLAGPGTRDARAPSPARLAPRADVHHPAATAGREGGGGMRRTRRAGVMTAIVGAVALVAVACGGGSNNPSGGGNPAGGGGGGSNAAQPPTAGMKPQTTIGQGEGQLNLIAWSGYVDDKWKKPFEQQTGCQVNAKYAGSSDQMVSLMANGGGGQYDLVSASGDADLRLLYAGDVRPVNVNLVPDWKNFFPAFQSPPFNTINGVHYG